jgi:hypothetical protein
MCIAQQLVVYQEFTALGMVLSLFVSEGTCLPSRCPAMNVYYDFTITAFARHVTIF